MLAVYGLEMPVRSNVRFGISRDPSRRLAEMRAGASFPIKLVCIDWLHGQHARVFLDALGRWQRLDTWTKGSAASVRGAIHEAARRAGIGLVAHTIMQSRVATTLERAEAIIAESLKSDRLGDGPVQWTPGSSGRGRSFADFLLPMKLRVVDNLARSAAFDNMGHRLGAGSAMAPRAIPSPGPGAGRAECDPRPDQADADPSPSTTRSS